MVQYSPSFRFVPRSLGPVTNNCQVRLILATGGGVPFVSAWVAVESCTYQSELSQISITLWEKNGSGNYTNLGNYATDGPKTVPWESGDHAINSNCTKGDALHLHFTALATVTEPGLTGVGVLDMDSNPTTCP